MGSSDYSCTLCDMSFADRKAFGRHLWEKHRLTPDQYRVQELGIGPKCCNPKCNNSVPRSTEGGWHKACSPFCAIEMGVDIPMGGGFGGPWFAGGPARSGALHADALHDEDLDDDNLDDDDLDNEDLDDDDFDQDELDDDFDDDDFDDEDFDDDDDIDDDEDFDDEDDEDFEEDDEAIPSAGASPQTAVSSAAASSATAAVSTPASPAGPFVLGDMLAISLAFLILGGLLAGIAGSLQYAIEHFLNWHAGTTFLMRVSGATILGTLAGAMLAALLANATSSLPTDRLEPPFFGGFFGGLGGALLGGLAGLFGWTQALIDPERGFQLPTVLARLFGVRWPGFWERVAGSAASVMLVMGLSLLIGVLAGGAHGGAETKGSRVFRSLLVFAPLTWVAYWVLANA